MRLLVGLGNPGARYARTRHNVGFMTAEEFLARHGRGSSRDECGAIVSDARWAGEMHLVARPMSFMNLSGGPVAALCRAYRLGPPDIIVVYDDADLPLGTIRIRPGGSASGHRGIASIIETLGEEGIPRVRLGIGRPGEEAAGLADYVLDEFDPGEDETVREMIRRSADALETMILRGVKSAMNMYNRRSRPTPSKA